MLGDVAISHLHFKNCYNKNLEVSTSVHVAIMDEQDLPLKHCWSHHLWLWQYGHSLLSTSYVQHLCTTQTLQFCSILPTSLACLKWSVLFILSPLVTIDQDIKCFNSFGQIRVSAPATACHFLNNELAFILVMV